MMKALSVGSQAKKAWVRPMPKFAIRNHSKFRMGMSYQEFGAKIFKSVPQMIGLRMAESIQRRQSIDQSGFLHFFIQYTIGVIMMFGCISN